MIIVLRVKEIENMSRVMGSCVSCQVVNILAAVPDQFIYDVIRDSCPVEPLEYTARIWELCRLKNSHSNMHLHVHAYSKLGTIQKSNVLLNQIIR